MLKGISVLSGAPGNFSWRSQMGPLGDLGVAHQKAITELQEFAYAVEAYSLVGI